MIPVDTVYQRVLALANKEQRGYITPQEFNLFANQAQASIFDQYFYDVNQFSRVPGNSTEHSDMVDLLDEKIDLHITQDEAYFDLTQNGWSISTDYYKITSLYYSSSLGLKLVERVNEKEFLLINSSPLTAPSEQRPIYFKRDNFMYLYPQSLQGQGSDKLLCNIVVKPNDVSWNYNVVMGSAVFLNGVDFTLHPSEENNLVLKILALAGITTKNPEVYQIAAAEENRSIQQEKQ